MKKKVLCWVLSLLMLSFVLPSFADTSKEPQLRSGYYCNKFSMTGSVKYFNTYYYCSDETGVTTAMSVGGSLYGTTQKAVALTSYSTNAGTNRVRVYIPYIYKNGSLTSYAEDARYNPNYNSNIVQPSTSFKKKTLAVQTLLYYLGYQITNDANYAAGQNYKGLDGICGSNTTNAIMAFQRDVGLPDDGIVGVSTWRALCSSAGYSAGSSIW